MGITTKRIKEFAYKKFDLLCILWIAFEVRKCLGCDDSRKPGIQKMNINSDER
jgi:hypothetical protein